MSGASFLPTPLSLQNAATTHYRSADCRSDARIGIEPGKSFDINKVDPPIRTGLVSAPKDALALMAWKVAAFLAS